MKHCVIAFGSLIIIGGLAVLGILWLLAVIGVILFCKAGDALERFAGLLPPPGDQQ